MIKSTLVGSLVVAFACGCGGASSSTASGGEPVAPHSSGNTSSDATGTTTSGPTDSSPVGTGNGTSRTGVHDPSTTTGTTGTTGASGASPGH